MQLSLGKNEVHVWWTLVDTINDPDLLIQCQSVLSSAEKQHQQRFVFEKDQKTYLVSHALVRHALSYYAPVDPAEWQFVENSHGKPFITGPAPFTDLRFNLSHTHGAAVVAVARGLEIGVDIESFKREGNWDEIAVRFFAPQEAAYIRLLNESRKTATFFDIWTLKEAYIKARGKGIEIPLEGFFFRLPESGHAPIEFHASLCDEHPDRWQFHQFTLAPAYRIALAVPVSAATPCTVVYREAVLRK